MNAAVAFQFIRIKAKPVLMPQFFGNQRKSLFQVFRFALIEAAAGYFRQFFHQIVTVVAESAPTSAPAALAATRAARPLGRCRIKASRKRKTHRPWRSQKTKSFR